MKIKRHNDDDKEEEDRLGDLSDCVLLRILSLLNTKQAVQTCILSTRWKYLWKHLTLLSLYSSYFDTQDSFTEFATQILSLRDDSTALYSLISTVSMVPPHLLEKILKYAVSHNVRRVRIRLLYNIEHIPSCIFSCHTLTSLDIIVHPNDKKLFPNSLNLPALTKLSLVHFVFGIDNDSQTAEPFSALKKLNSLVIRCCKVLNTQNLCISNVTLANLTIQTSQKWNYRKIELSTPRLSTFSYGGIPFENLCGSHLCSVKHVNIDAYMCSNNTKPPSNLLRWLRKLTKIKSLTVTSTTLQVLSLNPNLLGVKLHCLRNLKSLTIKMEGISSGSSTIVVDGKFLRLNVRCREVVAKFRESISKEGSPDIPNGIVDFLLQNSPSAKVHIIDQIQNVTC